MTDYNIPMAASSTPPAPGIDPGIITGMDQGIALNAKPFAPIDPQAAQAKSMAQQASIGEDKVKIESQQNAESDKMILRQIQQVYPDADMSTPEGIKKTMEYSKGKISSEGYNNMADLYGKKVTADLQLRKGLSEADAAGIADTHDKIEFNSQYINAPMIKAYEQTLTKTGSPEKARKAFEDTKQAVIGMVSQIKDPLTGQPKITPDVVKKIQASTYDQVVHINEVSDYTRAHMKAELDRRATETKIGLEKAQTEEQAALQAEHEKETENLRKGLTKEGKPLSGGGKEKESETPIGKANDDLKAGRITQEQYDKIVEGSAGGLGSRGEQIMMRIQGAAEEGLASLKNIAELPVSSSSGLFGHAEPGKSLIGSSFSVLANEMTTDDVKDYKATMAGLTKSLANMESQGMVSPGSLTKQMDALSWQQGDDNLTKMRKLAEARQIFEQGLKPLLHSTRVPQAEKEYTQGIIDQIKGAIPYTVHDVNEMRKSSKSRPDETPAQFLARTGTIKHPAPKPEGKMSDDEAAAAYLSGH